MNEIVRRLYIAEQTFTNTEYEPVIKEASQLYKAGKLSVCIEKLDSLPTEDDLLTQLITKLKGKSVHTTLEKIRKGKNVNEYTKAKALTSLLTHCLIEMECGRKEFRLLLPRLSEKVNEAVYGVM